MKNNKYMVHGRSWLATGRVRRGGLSPGRRLRRWIPAFAGMTRLSLLLVLCTVYFIQPLQAVEEKPNILIILVDTLRADYLGSYGFQGDVTPNLDSLAKESIQFNNAISPAPWTKPAIASLFTSLHPQTHRVVDHLGMHWKTVNNKYKASVLSDEAITLAEVLLQSGYDTIGLVGNDFLIRKFGYGQGFKRYYEPRPHNDVFSATPLFRKALKLIKKKKVGEPFFMYIHLMDTHGPFQCTGEDYDVLEASPSYGENVVLDQEERKAIPHELGYRIPWRGSERALHVNNWRNCYAAGVRKFDRRFGPFLKDLKENGVLDNTIIVFTSDHGEELYDHQGWAHSHTLHSELLRVPFILYLPGGQYAGLQIDKTVSLLDVMPTLLAQVGIDFQMENWGGRDLTSIIQGQDELIENWAYGSATRHNPEMVSSQNNRYKIIWNYPRGKPELYDLKRDPLEKQDIAQKKPGMLRHLKRQMTQHIRNLKRGGNLVESSVVLSDEMIERLKSLGYLQ